MPHRRLTCLSALTLLWGGLGGAGASVAAPEECEEGFVCVWTGPDYAGERTDYGPDAFSGECLARVFESVVNATHQLTAFAYPGAGCDERTSATVVGPGERVRRSGSGSLSIRPRQ